MAASDLSDLNSKLRGLLEEAFERGRREGAQEMRDHILRAATAPVDVPSVRQAPRVSAPTQAARAQRGILPGLVGQLLSESPGLSGSEVERRVAAMNQGVAGRSASNELRRGLRLGIYRQDVHKHWFLAGSTGEETAGAATNDHPAAA